MKKLTAILLAAVLLLSLLAGCSQKDGQEQGGQQPENSGGGQGEDVQQPEASGRDSMTVALSADVGTFDPYVASQDQELSLARNLYDSLTWLVAGQSEPTMRIAEKYELSDDGTEYLFTLRDDVYFHNGEKLTVDDVLYSFEKFRAAPATMGFAAYIDTVEAVGDNQVKVTLLAPSGSFFESLNWLAIVPKAAHEAANGDFSTNPVGSGAYMLSSQTAGVQFEIKAFDQYYLGQPEIKTVTYKIIPDQSTVAVALQTGEIDYSKNVAFTAIPELEKAENVDCGVRPTSSIFFVFLNTEIAPYDNALVRKAINMVMDRDMCNTVMYESYGQTADQMLSTSVFGHSEKLKGYDYDAEKAAELLAEAGYPGGAGFPPVTIETIEAYSRVAQVVQNGLSSIGIAAEIQVQEQNAFIGRALQGDVPFGILSIGLGGDASAWSVMFKSGEQFNLARYSSGEFDALFDEAGSERDSARRLELYEQAFTILEDEAVWVPLLYVSICHGWNSAFDVDRALEVGDNNIQPFYVTAK